MTRKILCPSKADTFRLHRPESFQAAHSFPPKSTKPFNEHWQGAQWTHWTSHSLPTSVRSKLQHQSRSKPSQHGQRTWRAAIDGTQTAKMPYKNRSTLPMWVRPCWCEDCLQAAQYPSFSPTSPVAAHPWAKQRPTAIGPNKPFQRKPYCMKYLQCVFIRHEPL